MRPSKPLAVSPLNTSDGKKNTEINGNNWSPSATKKIKISEITAASLLFAENTLKTLKSRKNPPQTLLQTIVARKKNSVYSSRKLRSSTH
jgi:hypothetical protein